MPSRVVRPETTKLPISGGDWLLVKKRLSSGEQRAAFARRYIAGLDGMLHVNPLQTGLAQITAYLVDWSLTNVDETPLVIRGEPIEAVEAALNSIDPESFAEIRDAIHDHEEAMAAARAEEKKVPTGSLTAPPTCSLPSDADGKSTGSAS